MLKRFESPVQSAADFAQIKLRVAQCPTRMNAQDEGYADSHLIATISCLVDQIAHRPVERVSPYAQSLEAVAYRLSSVVHSTRGLGTSQSPHLQPNDGLDSQWTAVLQQSPMRPMNSSHNGKGVKARDIVSAMARHTEQLGRMLNHDRMAAELLETDERITHLGPLFVQQGRAKTQNVTVQDHLLLACSCLSLSQDFADFEKAQGWPSKVETLTSRILAGEEPACQAIGKHSQEFFALHSSFQTHRHKVDAAIRQGNKIQIFRSIGQRAGLGDAFGLLAAFQSRKLDRLSYSEFHHVLEALQIDDGAFRPIAEFCQKHSEWWSLAIKAYHAKHSTIVELAKLPIRQSSDPHTGFFRPYPSVRKDSAYSSPDNWPLPNTCDRAVGQEKILHDTERAWQSEQSRPVHSDPRWHQGSSISSTKTDWDPQLSISNLQASTSPLFYSGQESSGHAEGALWAGSIMWDGYECL